MSNLTIVFNKGFPMLIEVLDTETGKHFHGVEAFHLSVTAPDRMEAKIITEGEALVEDHLTVEGKCTVPVTEQLVISQEFMTMLARLVARELTHQLVSTQADNEELRRQFTQWMNELDDKEEAFIARVEKRLVQKSRMQIGVVS